MKILVRVPNWIGDSILSIPAIQGLSASGRNEVTVIAHERVKEIFESVEEVNRILSFEKGFPFWIGLRKERYDLGVLFPFSFSSAFLLALSGARVRVGYDTEGRGIFLTHPIPLSKDYRKHHLIETYLEIPRSLGMITDGGEPRVSISSDAPETIPYLHRTWNGLPLLIGIGPEAAYGVSKRWGRYPELLNRLHDYGDVVVLGSGEGEFPETSHDSRINDLRGKTTLKETLSILKRCKILISNDSGLGHLASAVGTPVLSIFGSTSPHWTRPLGSRNRVIYKRLWCSPCFARTCRFRTYACLEEISVEEVLKVVEEMMEINIEKE